LQARFESHHRAAHAPETGNRMQTQNIVHDGEWDAGDLGCGELVIHLRNRLRAMPGKVLRLTARDPGAPADIPAYCRMTGHELLNEDPAQFSYWIRARVERPK
jgi:tRNA 2-thiouridine synthesizing protein A